MGARSRLFMQTTSKTKKFVSTREAVMLKGQRESRTSKQSGWLEREK
jgi:hypothetical protein